MDIRQHGGRARRRLIRRRDVKDKTGLPDSTRDDLIRAGDFPRPISIGPRAVAWIEDQVDDWIERKIEASRNGDDVRRDKAP